jgi:hypothetical protein
LIVVIVGLVVTTIAADAVVICLQFGWDAYFRDGVRPIPHRGFFNLSNGQSVTFPYKAIFGLLWMISFALWIALSVVVVVAAKNAQERHRESRTRGGAGG